MPKWEACNGLKEVFAFYMLQFKRFTRSRYLMESGGPKSFQHLPKLKLLRPSGGFLVILGRFFKEGILINLGGSRDR